MAAPSASTAVCDDDYSTDTETSVLHAQASMVCWNACRLPANLHTGWSKQRPGTKQPTTLRVVAVPGTFAFQNSFTET